MGYLIGFEDKDSLNAQVVGRKFCALAKAFRGGFDVPQAVAIHTDAHRYYLANNRWPDGLAEDVYAAAHKLEISRGLSIRSSATREDLEHQSFAGQYRSFLQVINQQDLKNSIEECWQSFASESVKGYLTAKLAPDQNTDTPLMAVVIQKMVNARAAGIAFSRNPMKPSGKEIVIEAVKGLGEDLVSGHSTPYRAVVDENRMVKLTLPDSKSRVYDGTDQLLHQYPFWRKIARLIKDLESHNGKKPLDIEWAVDEQDKIWLLQSRAITTLDGSAAGIPPGLWTRKIANDLWADRLTPFLAHHMLQNAPHFNFSRTLKLLGVPVIKPALTVIKGYLYINGESIKNGISYIPYKLRLPELDALLPTSAEPDRLPGPSWPTLLTVGFRSILLLFLEPAVNPLVCLWRANHNLKTLSREIDRVSAMPEDSPSLVMAKIRAALETLTQLQIKNQWPYFFATFTTWLLHWLAVNRLGLTHSDFLKLISENGNNVSIEIEQYFRKMAGEIVRHTELAELFQNDSVDWRADDFPTEIKNDLNNFLARYGCRSRHRTLFIRRWAEAPQEVIGILQTLVRNQLNSNGADYDRSRSTEPDRETKFYSPAGDLTASAGGGLSIARWSLRLLAKKNRRFLDLREELRFTLDRILYLIRTSLLTFGNQTGLGDKAMLLNAEELDDLVKGNLTYREAKRRAHNRYNEFMEPFEGATYYNEGLAEDEFQTDGTLIRGIGTSPGRISGRAKIVDNPSRADIQSGDILIAKNTDPGWTPILCIVGGMVMEEGGLLNHCSIVARELGVPSIVGVEGATRRIPDNSQVTIDGGMGMVWFEE